MPIPDVPPTKTAVNHSLDSLKELLEMRTSLMLTMIAAVLSMRVN
jgi:hypothetical protein